GVVRPDEKICAGPLQFFRRAQHDLAHAFPVEPCVNGLHVLGQRGGVHCHFRVRVPAQERFGFKTNRAIAKARSFRAAPDNAYMLHTRKSIFCRNRSFFSTGRNEASKEFRASSRRCSSENSNSCCASSYSLVSEVWNMAGSSVFSVTIKPWSK